MAKALRMEFPGAVYHITSRGNERRPIFYDPLQRQVKPLSSVDYGETGAVGRI